MPNSCHLLRPTPSSCTVFRRTAAWKSPRKSSTAPSRSSSINPKTACTCRRPSCILYSDPAMQVIASHRTFFVAPLGLFFVASFGLFFVESFGFFFVGSFGLFFVGAQHRCAPAWQHLNAREES